MTLLKAIHTLNNLKDNHSNLTKTELNNIKRECILVFMANTKSGKDRNDTIRTFNKIGK